MPSNPFKQTSLEPERIPNVESLHTYLLETEEWENGPLTSTIPDLPGRRDICKNFFSCNIWDVEPYLIDDLNNAKLANDKDEIRHIREMIRAASWASHGRTDAKKCLELAKSINLTNKAVLDTLKRFLCDDEVESAVRFIEEEIDNEWDKIAKNTNDAAKARERLHVLRPIRDQLYFQRLYAELCSIGKGAKTPSN